jgi:hypothetical protein
MEVRGVPILNADNSTSETLHHELQQWFGPELPAYLRDDSVGEWRPIPVGIGSP